MSLGAEPTQTDVNLGDTAELYAFIFEPNEIPVDSDDIVSVVFKIKKPDATITTQTGEVQDEGVGFARFTGTSATGLYLWTAQFTFVSGEKRTYRDEFNVVDPLETYTPTERTQIGDEVWMRIEDCFDSELGGPWLRDMTLAYFDRPKVERFISEGLLRINMLPPLTNFDLSMFTTFISETDPAIITVTPGATQPDPDRIVIVQGTLVAVIRHLMRSYTEQPDPRGANIVYQDRRDYLARWQSIYTIEEAFFKEITLLWKRQFLNYGKSALLVHSKAGRLYPPGFRARNSTRGW